MNCLFDRLPFPLHLPFKSYHPLNKVAFKIRIQVRNTFNKVLTRERFLSKNFITNGTQEKTQFS